MIDDFQPPPPTTEPPEPPPAASPSGVRRLLHTRVPAIASCPSWQSASCWPQPSPSAGSFCTTRRATAGRKPAGPRQSPPSRRPHPESPRSSPRLRRLAMRCRRSLYPRPRLRLCRRRTQLPASWLRRRVSSARAWRSGTACSSSGAWTSSSRRKPPQAGRPRQPSSYAARHGTPWMPWTVPYTWTTARRPVGVWWAKQARRCAIQSTSPPAGEGLYIVDSGTLYRADLSAIQPGSDVLTMTVVLTAAAQYRRLPGQRDRRSRCNQR